MSPPTGPNGPTPPRILVVGRDDGERSAIVREVEAMGYTYESFASGLGAAEALLTGSFQLMIADAGLESPDLRTLKSVGEIFNDGFRCLAWADPSDDGAVERALRAAPFACIRLPARARDLRFLVELVTQSSTEGKRKA